MSNTPARSPLGVFYRSPLGVRGCAGGDVYLMGDFTRDYSSYGWLNATIYSVAGKKIETIIVGTHTNNTDILYVQTLSDGSFVCQGLGYVGQSHGYNTFRCSKSGEVLWSYDAQLYDESRGLALDSDDNAYVLLDRAYSPGVEASTLMIFDKQGNSIDHTMTGLEEGLKFNSFSGVSVDSVGHIVVSGYLAIQDTGSQEGPIGTVYKQEEYSIVKFDDKKNVLWKRGYFWIEYTRMGWGGWVQTDRYEDEFYLFHSCVFDDNGNVYALASSKQWSNDNDWLVKLSQEGSVVWSSQCLGATYLAVDMQGCVYVAGNRFEGVTTRKFSPDGTLLWTADHGKDVVDLKVDRYGNLYTVGYRLASPDVTSLRKYSPSGELVWSGGYGNTSSYDYAYCVALSKRISIPKRTET